MGQRRPPHFGLHVGVVDVRDPLARPVPHGELRDGITQLSIDQIAKAGMVAVERDQVHVVHYFFPPPSTSARSASTIMATSSLNFTRGSHFKRRLAFSMSPRSSSTSAGR